jgi:Transglutaminase-like superfamily
MVRDAALAGLFSYSGCSVRGEPAELVIGIDKEASALHSHAWIELRRRVIGDQPQFIRRFTLLLRF